MFSGTTAYPHILWRHIRFLCMAMWPLNCVALPLTKHGLAAFVSCFQFLVAPITIISMPSVALRCRGNMLGFCLLHTCSQLANSLIITETANFYEIHNITIVISNLERTFWRRRLKKIIIINSKVPNIVYMFFFLFNWRLMHIYYPSIPFILCKMF